MMNKVVYKVLKTGNQVKSYNLDSELAYAISLSLTASVNFVN